MKSRKYFFAAGVFGAMSLVALFTEWFFVSFSFPFVAIVLLSIGLYYRDRDIVISEHAAFSDMSNFKIGMKKDDVMRLNSMYLCDKVDEVNEGKNGTCETCGGKIENGVCTYCGNKYDDNSEITYLIYDTRYGKRTFTFKGPILTNMKICVKPLEKFL